jgi:hypothetical protein
MQQAHSIKPAQTDRHAEPIIMLHDFTMEMGIDKAWSKPWESGALLHVMAIIPSRREHLMRRRAIVSGEWPHM